MKRLYGLAIVVVVVFGQFLATHRPVGRICVNDQKLWHMEVHELKICFFSDKNYRNIL